MHSHSNITVDVTNGASSNGGLWTNGALVLLLNYFMEWNCVKLINMII